MIVDIQASESDPEIRAALGRLCRRGVVDWWVQDEAEALLKLACVRARVRDHGEEIDPVEALIEILRELVSTIRHQSYGKILWIVLALDARYLGLTAKERRTLAGREFRGGRDQVSEGTIRQVHEKPALDRLAVLLENYDRPFRDSN